MGHTSNKINRTNGISIIGDIDAILNVGSGDLGTLCKSNNVNKWSRNKPVRSTTLTQATMSEVNYGIDIPQAGYASLSALVSAIDGGYAWEYLKPRGQSQNPKEWFRAFDFTGYYHIAPDPLEFSQNTQKTVYDGVTTTSVTVGFAKNPETDTDSVTLGILHPNNNQMTFSSMYFGVLLYCSSPTLYFAKTQDSTFSSISNSSDAVLEITGVSCPNAGTRTYRAIPFFSTVQIGNTITGSSTFNGTLYPIPLAECTVSITQEAVTTMTNVFSYTNSGQTNPLYYRLNINTNTDINGVQYRIIACKTASGTTAPDDVTLVTGTINTSGTGNIYIPSSSTWSSVNNLGFNPMVTEENGYSYIRCELRRGEIAVGTHSVLNIAWGQGSTPWDDI